VSDMKADEFVDDPRRLEGVCELHWEDGLTEKVRCRIDLQHNRFVCQRSFSDTFAVHDALSDEIPAIYDVQIVTPAGELTADVLKPSFVVQRGGGQHNIARTDCSSITGILGVPSEIGFVFNRPIRFNSSRAATEVLYTPTFDTGRPIVLNDNLYLVGSKRGFSVVGDSACSDPDLDRSVSVTLGAEASRIVQWDENTVSIWLNNYRPTRRGRPFVDVGSPFIDLNKCAKNFATIFVSTQEYFSRLDGPKSEKADNALRSLLDARSSASNYMAGLLCIFHFLEWFDNSKTMSANTLVTRLGISREEANAVIKLRNGIVHGNAEPGAALLNCHTELFQLTHPRNNFANSSNPAMGVLNYLHSVVGEAFVREIGYKGGVSNFI
tara:strand:+ start:136 stop:1278 length:1143 start_codon:yes stop_codon:yes gene_type:complete